MVGAAARRGRAAIEEGIGERLDTPCIWHNAGHGVTFLFHTFSRFTMREYRFQATDDTVENLRRLRREWTGYTVSDLAFTVTLADGSGVRIQVEAVDVEDLFEAFRIEAIADPSPDTTATSPGDFGAGGNDVVLFTGASWSESGAQPTEASLAGSPLPASASMHFSGHPGQLSETADVVCLTTDAIVIAASTGEGLLVRTGLKPYSLDVISDRAAISTFLLERGYQE
jgi:hypothetical protein